MPETRTASQLRDFLEYRAEILQVEDKQKASSRPPASYDKHLPDELVLRRLLHDPSLAKTFADLADHFAEKRVREGTLPPWADMSPTNVRLDFNKMLARNAQSEDAVRLFYVPTFAHYAARIASVLYLGSTASSWGSAIVAETDDKGTPRADLLLRWRGGDYDSYLDLEAKEKACAARGFNPCLVTFEFKSLTVAQELPKLLRLVEEHCDTEFQWISCGSDGDPSEKKCRAHPPASVQGVQAAFDALEPTRWISNSIREMLRVHHVAPSEMYERLPCPRKTRLSLRIRLAAQANKATDLKEDVHDPLDFVPRYILQQVWAEAVHHDVTYVLISTNNTEYFCVRHRQTQTLYVSDYIDHQAKDSPPMGKLHVGFFIAAMDDSIERAKIATDRTKSGLAVHIPNLGPVGSRPGKLPLSTGSKEGPSEQTHAETSHNPLEDGSNGGGRGRGRNFTSTSLDGGLKRKLFDTESAPKGEAIHKGKPRDVGITCAAKKRPKSCGSSLSPVPKKQATSRSEAEVRPVRAASQRRRTRKMQ